MNNTFAGWHTRTCVAPVSKCCGSVDSFLYGPIGFLGYFDPVVLGV